jgi:LysM repeat protein/anti-sigma regulatory factor (Ser/Thr protein kinase)
MDVLSLEGALHNLVNNAIEAMPKGGVLRIRTLETPDRRRVGIEIKDSGMGMNPQTLRRVLQAPFQTTKKTGTGLGLYIAKYIFRRHKALLQWKSQPGKGTTVTVLFPKANARRLALTPASVPSAPPSPASIEKTPRVRTQNLWSKVFHAFTIIAVMIAPLRATAIPQLLRVQGRFLDNQNVPLTDNLPVRFSIWDSPDGYGNLLWQDVQAVSIQDNAFQVVLGRKTPLPPTVFSGGDRWMEMQIGEDAPLRPRHKIPAQYLQAQIAEVSRVPEPAAPPAAAPTPPGISADEKHDLELQIERYREIATAAQEKLTHEQAAKDELARKQAADAQAEAQSEQEAQEKADRDREAAKAAKAAAHKKAHLHPKPPIEVQVDAESGETKNVYTVQNGDTLKSIAQKLYGRAELWYDLYYLNRDRLGPMGYVSAGQILVLPSKTPDESAR